MQTAQLQAILTMAAMLLIPAGFGGVGFVLIREASIKARPTGAAINGLWVNENVSRNPISPTAPR